MTTYIAASIEDIAKFWDRAADASRARQNRGRTKRDIRDAEVEERCYREVAYHLRHVKFEDKSIA